MNWEAIGAIGEILGAAAVIATLIYLATQVRQSSKSIDNATAWAITQALADVNARISSDSDLTELWLRGRKNLSDLDEVESERFRAYAMDLLNLAIYVHIHPTAEHQYYIDHVAQTARDFPGFKEMVVSVGPSFPQDLYETLTGNA